MNLDVMDSEVSKCFSVLSDALKKGKYKGFDNIFNLRVGSKSEEVGLAVGYKRDQVRIHKLFVLF